MAKPNHKRKRGVSLVEVMLVLAVMGVLVSMSAPSFRRSMEQSRADIAGSNLRAIWAAQRVYWLEHRSYAADLSALTSSGLLDPTVISSSTYYLYTVRAADSSSFTSTATRTGSTRWSGYFTIDAEGNLSGAIQAAGEPNIVPGFQ
jgi:type IV pilus assembly protein PilE